MYIYIYIYIYITHCMLSIVCLLFVFYVCVFRAPSPQASSFWALVPAHMHYGYTYVHQGQSTCNIIPYIKTV